MTKKNELATVEPQGLATPAYLSEYAGMGNEGVSREDMSVPRLVVLQALSPQCTEGDQKYIEGARAGMLLNTLTNDLCKTQKVVNCYFVKEFAVFRKRSEGGGFKGTFSTLDEAASCVNSQDECDKYEVIEQGVHYCLLLGDDKDYQGEAAVVMTSSKLKVSRQWNSLIAFTVKGGARFSGVWNLTTASEKNAKGSFFNFKVSPGGFCPEELMPVAEGLYLAVRGGAKKVSQDVDHEGVVSDEPNY